MNRFGCAILATLALTLVLCGCDFFRAAQPEAPTEAPFTASYISPDATLQTMMDAVADKARTIGFTAYSGAFAESTSASTPAFHQFFWPTDAAYWESSDHTVPPDWTLALERKFYINFANLRGDPYELDFTPDQDNPDVIGADGATIHRHYVIRTLADDKTTPTGFLAIGFADLTFIRTQNGDWKITRWDDRIDSNADPNDTEQISLGRRRLNTTQ